MKLFGALVCVLLFASSANADSVSVSILSQGTIADPSEYNNGTGDNVLLTAYPGVWQGPTMGANWISYADTGMGGPADNTMVKFFQPFFLPYSTNTGSITVWADDTAAVYLDGVLKYPANYVAGSACADGPIGCITANGGVIDLTGISGGSHELRFDTYQLHGDGYGLLYAGSVTSVPDGGMTLMLLGGVLVGLETLRRKFRA
jgi:hypothetical protein